MPTTSQLPVLIVGQTPPPYHGQAIMIRQLLDSPPPGFTLAHVRMAFSRDVESVGRLHVHKLLHLARVVFSIVVARLRVGRCTLYYPPAGPHRIPVYRDIVVLGLTRWLFRRTVFHFHASGLSQLLPRLHPVERWLCRLAYAKPDVAIQTSAANPPDGEFLGARRVVVVEYGLPDEYPRFQAQARAQRAAAHRPRVLFVGTLYESKGVRVLLEAACLLHARGFEVEVEFIGDFESRTFETEARGFAEHNRTGDYVHFNGARSGEAKWRAFASADVFCFPSYYESESFGLVNLEAMMFELPVVSTSWRGITGVVRDGVSGFLTPVKDPWAVAEHLGALLRDPTLRHRMGAAGRRIYLERFSLESWRAGMADALAP